MLIIGCDYHPSVQQIAFVDLETAEADERRLLHGLFTTVIVSSTFDSCLSSIPNEL
jgi:hypothetical protein